MLYSERTAYHGTSGMAAVDISSFPLEAKLVLGRAVGLEQFDFCVSVARFGLRFVTICGKAGSVSMWRGKISFTVTLTLYASCQDG